MPAFSNTMAWALRIVALAVLAGISSQGIAMFALMSDEELVRRSDLIVFGHWAGQSSLQLSAAGERLEIGVIAIQEVLKGPSEQSIALVAVAAHDGLRSSSNISYARNAKGLWLLRQKPGTAGIYLADHPQRFLAEGKDAKRIEMIRAALKQRSP